MSNRRQEYYDDNMFNNYNPKRPKNYMFVAKDCTIDTLKEIIDEISFNSTNPKIDLAPFPYELALGTPNDLLNEYGFNKITIRGPNFQVTIKYNRKGNMWQIEG